jgi:hypothetical protein
VKRCVIGVIGVAFACMLAGLPASAAPIAYGSFTGTVINFDNLAGATGLGAGEILTNQYAGFGVTFAVPNFNAYANNGLPATSSSLNSDPNVVWVDQGGGGGGASAQGMDIFFSTPVSHVGLYFGGSIGSTFSLAAYNGATLLEVLTAPLPPGGVGLEGFLALQNANITRAVVYSTSNGQNWNFDIDDLKFDAAPIPEPTSLLLLGTGLAGLRAWRKRRT